MQKYIKDLTENECIHTPTEGIYNKLTTKFHELGLRWRSKDDYIKVNKYRVFTQRTVLYPKNGKYECVNYANSEGHTIYTINDLKDFDMETEKQITLTIEQAKELYSLQPNLRSNILSDFTDEELGIMPILKSWKDLNFNGTYYPLHDGHILCNGQGIGSRSRSYLDSPTKATVKATFATAQLSMLLHDLPKGNKWAIVRYDDELEVRAIESDNKTFFLLTFHDESLADAFLVKHERLIRDYHLLP